MNTEENSVGDKYWILCGKPENWEIALRDGIWGLIPKFRGVWRYLQKGDRLFFYATSPVTGVIGFGRVEAKFKQNKPLWPDEIQQKQVLYPFRFEFRCDYILPRDSWKTGKIKISLPIGSYSAVNLLSDQDIIDRLCDEAKRNWNVQFEPSEELTRIYKSKAPSATEKAHEPSHDEIKKMIFEIGRIHRYITEKEYPIDGDRLDVVWRRVERSVPTYVFEIQVGGDVYHALAKLKHAYDMWNSNIFLVVGEEGRQKVEELLSGTFHEIRNILIVVTPEKVKRLHSLQIQDEKLRKEIGLL